MTKPLETFTARLDEVIAGSRGFVSIPSAAKELGIPAKTLRQIAEDRGLNVERHGKYGYCAFELQGRMSG